MGSMVPIVASAEELDSAIRFAQLRPTARWYVASRAAAFGRSEAIPPEWGMTAATVSDEAREKAADNGEALPDGSYPIRNKADLENAIQAFGRAENKARVRSHIRKRARALGCLSMLPDSWKHRKSATTASAEPITAGLGHQLAKAFDEALHPRGHDGKFINVGGRVQVLEGGHAVREGKVTKITKRADGGTDVHLIDDAGHETVVNPKNLQNAPTARAHVGEGDRVTDRVTGHRGTVTSVEGEHAKVAYDRSGNTHGHGTAPTHQLHNDSKTESAPNEVRSAPERVVLRGNETYSLTQGRKLSDDEVARKAELSARVRGNESAPPAHRVSEYHTERAAQAEAASKKANESGSAEDHIEAAKRHYSAANAAHTAKNRKVASEHQGRGAEHEAVAKRASKSDAPESARDPAVDHIEAGNRSLANADDAIKDGEHGLAQRHIEDARISEDKLRELGRHDAADDLASARNGVEDHLAENGKDDDAFNKFDDDVHDRLRDLLTDDQLDEHDAEILESIHDHWVNGHRSEDEARAAAESIHRKIDNAEYEAGNARQAASEATRAADVATNRAHRLPDDHAALREAADAHRAAAETHRAAGNDAAAGRHENNANNFGALAQATANRPQGGDAAPSSPKRDYANHVLEEAEGYQESNLDDEDPAQDDRLDAIMTHTRSEIASGDEDRMHAAASELKDYLIREGYADNEDFNPDPSENLGTKSAAELNAVGRGSTGTPRDQAFQAELDRRSVHARGLSEKADAASKQADVDHGDPTAGAHAHQNAAERHSDALDANESAGNFEEAAHHRDLARYHDEQAKAYHANTPTEVQRGDDKPAWKHLEEERVARLEEMKKAHEQRALNNLGVETPEGLRARIKSATDRAAGRSSDPSMSLEERTQRAEIFAPSMQGMSDEDLATAYQGYGRGGDEVMAQRDAAANELAQRGISLGEAASTGRAHAIGDDLTDGRRTTGRASAPTAGDDHALHGIAKSVENKGGDRAAARARVNEILANSDHAAAHRDLAKLMGEAKLGGKQRARYREALNVHHGSGGSSIPAGSLSADNPLRDRLSAKQDAVRPEDLSDAELETLASRHKTAAESNLTPEGQVRGHRDSLAAVRQEQARRKAEPESLSEQIRQRELADPGGAARNAQEQLAASYSEKELNAAIRRYSAGTQAGDVARAERAKRDADARTPKSQIGDYVGLKNSKAQYRVVAHKSNGMTTVVDQYSGHRRDVKTANLEVNAPGKAHEPLTNLAAIPGQPAMSREQSEGYARHAKNKLAELHTRMQQPYMQARGRARDEALGEQHHAFEMIRRHEAMHGPLDERPTPTTHPDVPAGPNPERIARQANGSVRPGHELDSADPQTWTDKELENQEARLAGVRRLGGQAGAGAQSWARRDAGKIQAERQRRDNLRFDSGRANRSATDTVNEALRDSGNGDRTPLGVVDEIRDELRRDPDGENITFKPPGGYEVTIPRSTAEKLIEESRGGGHSEAEISDAKFRYSQAQARSRSARGPTAAQSAERTKAEAAQILRDAGYVLTANGQWRKAKT